jgi:DNA-binding NtrC family response regulator
MRDIITQDRRTSDLIELAKTVATSRAHILIQGERGTGKALLARHIHKWSSRSNQLFIALSCKKRTSVEIVQELIEQPIPVGCTVFLEEIGLLDMETQSKILALIEDPAKNIRLYASTSQGLSEMTKRGLFSEALFSKLQSVLLNLPPLRERKGDVKVLVDYLVPRLATRAGKKITSVEESVIQYFETLNFSGNLDELQTKVEAMIANCSTNVLCIKDLGQSSQPVASVQGASAASGDQVMSWMPGATLNEIEKNVIIDALKYHGGNRTHTAKALGISIRTLRNKLAEYRKIGIYA